jgi:hypothetical protein
LGRYGPVGLNWKVGIPKKRLENDGKWANFAGSITMEYVKPMRNPLLGEFVEIFEIVSGGSF